MKQFLFLLVTTIAFSAWSQQRLDERIYSKADSVQRLIQERTYRLSTRTQLAVLEQLRALEITLLSDSVPQPIPEPVPNPTPYPGDRISVRGSIESRSFSFDVGDSLELYQKCTTFVRDQNLTQADDVRVSVNFQPEMASHNSSAWWAGAGQMCVKIAEMASSQGVRMARYGLVFAGSVESAGFLFTGNNLVEIDQQCTNFVQRNRITQADDILVTRDFIQSRAYHNSNAYWTGAYEICQRIIQGFR